MEIGDKVLCIKNLCCLKQDKIYEIHNIISWNNSSLVECIQIFGDLGSHDFNLKTFDEYFVLIDEQKEEWEDITDSYEI